MILFQFSKLPGHRLPRDRLKCMSSAYETRRAKLAQVLAQEGVAAYVAAGIATLTYLHAMHETGGERFLGVFLKADGSRAMVAPRLSATQAERLGITDVRPWIDGEDPLALVSALGSEWGLTEAKIAVDDDMPAHMVLGLQQALPKATLVLGHELRAKVMAIKDSDELAALHAAGAAADGAWDEVRPQIKAGLTEIAVAEMLQNAMKARGGKPLFSIIAAGAGAAEPHHGSDETVIREGDVVICDFGCEVDGYVSDITRTVVVGQPTDEQKKVYDLVHRAHHAARAAIKPGVAFQDVDRAARAVITEGGYGEYFIHRTGHGVGMNVHEAPNVVEGETRPLQPGHCFSIEPGIYLPGRFGVRIENLVTVTEEGHASFNVDPAAELTSVG